MLNVSREMCHRVVHILHPFFAEACEEDFRRDLGFFGEIQAFCYQ